MGKRERIKRQQYKANPAAREKPRERSRPGDWFDSPPFGGSKMADRLRDLAAPWWDEAKSEEDLQVLLEAARIAWNLSLFPPDQRAIAFDEVRPRLSRERRDLLGQMIARKESVCPNDRRIVDGVAMGRVGPEEARIEALASLGPVDSHALRRPSRRPGPLTRIGRWLLARLRAGG